MRSITSIARIFSILFVLAFFQACSLEEPVDLRYTVYKTEWNGQPALKVSLRCSPNPAGPTRILFQDQAWGEEDLYNNLKDPELTAGQGRLEIVRDSGWIAISGENEDPDELLGLSYYIIQDQPLGSEAGDPTYRPIVQPDYFHVFGHNLLALPEHVGKPGDSLLNIDIRWEGWDAGEVIHNSFGSRERDQEIRNITAERFHSSIFVGGDYRIYQTEVEANQLLLAVRGDWIPFKDEQVFQLLEETIRAQRDFWQDHSQEYFTVTLRPYPQKDGSSYQGTGLTNSFATSMSNNEHTEFDQLVHLFNHELMHNWIGHTIQNESEEAQYWFSEGFTEYYTIKNIARAGIAGQDGSYYIDQVNEKIRLLESLSVRNEPNSEITYENFWKDREYSDLPYHRGFLYAFYLDQYIQKARSGERSLDDVMRKLLERSLSEGVRVSHPVFLEALEDVLGENPEPFFQDHIVEGQTLPLDDFFRSMGLDYVPTSYVFDLGFRMDAERRHALDVDPESNAYAAGLREGDRITSRSIYLGNTEKSVELTVVREGTPRPISFLPRRQAEIPQLINNESNRGLLRM